MTRLFKLQQQAVTVCSSHSAKTQRPGPDSQYNADSEMPVPRHCPSLSLSIAFLFGEWLRRLCGGSGDRDSDPSPIHVAHQQIRFKLNDDYLIKN
jgi:hypothetical protein